MLEQPALDARQTDPLGQTGRASAAAKAQIAPVVPASDHLALLLEVRALAAHIDGTRRELAVLAADQAVKSHVMLATDELDAIVVHTAEATETILDVCENLDAVASGCCHETIAASTAKIYEACSFQDITGQRVGKVVQTLKLIEFRIAEILHVFGDNLPPCHQPAGVQAGGEGLLNGPQRQGAAMRQGEVDALLDIGE